MRTDAIQFRSRVRLLIENTKRRNQSRRRRINWRRQELSYMAKVRAAIIGLGFGAEFIPIYQKHPEAEVVAVCRRDAAKMNEVADAFGIAKRYTAYEQVLSD